MIRTLAAEHASTPTASVNHQCGGSSHRVDSAEKATRAAQTSVDASGAQYRTQLFLRRSRRGSQDEGAIIRGRNTRDAAQIEDGGIGSLRGSMSGR
jgi:hypothetical protein